MHPVAMNSRHGQRESPHYKAQDWSELYGCVHRVALMPQAIETHCRMISVKALEKPAEQALALATEP